MKVWKPRKKSTAAVHRQVEKAAMKARQKWEKKLDKGYSDAEAASL